MVVGILLGIGVISSFVLVKSSTREDDGPDDPRPDQWEDWETDRLNQEKEEDEAFWKAHYASGSSPSATVEYDGAPSEEPVYDDWPAEEIDEEEAGYEEEEEPEEEDED